MLQDPPRPAEAGRPAFWWAVILLVAGIELIAVGSGGDASWDLRNYHLYNPFALLHKPYGTDIAPAHMQTFFSPTLDLFYAGLARTIPSTALLNAALAVPHAVAVVLAFVIAWRLLQPRDSLQTAALAILAAIAGTGTAALSTIAMSMSEALPAALVLGAWLVLIGPSPERLPDARRLFGAGLLVGAACGFKLTLSFATIALLLVLLLLPWPNWRRRLAAPVLCGIGVFLGTAALTGYWWAIEWQRYGNPLFPLLNQIFRSPFALPQSFQDTTFLPRTWAEGLAAPWSWTLSLSWATGESRLRDPRFALALLAACAALVRFAVRRPRLPWPFLALPAWLVLGFVLWRVEFSIHRYLSVLEFASGAVIALAVVPLLRARPLLLLGGTAAFAAACTVLTVYPQLARTAPGFAPPFDVDLGPLPQDSMVLLLDNEPMGYLASFADPRIRFIGTNDFFMSLDGSNPMQPAVERAIATHAGPLFGLEAPGSQADRDAATLAHYRLRRGECRGVTSNLSPDPIRLCALSRAPSG